MNTTAPPMPVASDRLPPQQMDAEKSLLGLTLCGNVPIAEVRAIVQRADYFNLPEHQRLYGVMLHLDDTGRPVDIITIKSALSEQGRGWKDVGGSAYLGTVMEWVQQLQVHGMQAGNWRGHAELIRDAAAKREFIRLTDRWRLDALDGTSDPAQLVDLAHRELDEVSRIAQPREAFAAQLDLVRADAVAPESVRYFWRDRIAFGMLNLLAGPPSSGKSFLTIDMVARHSTGRPFPDNPSEPAPIGNSVIFNAEDAVANTIVPRLRAAQADLSRVVIARGTVRKENAEPGSISLARDLPLIEAAIVQNEATLCTVDPVGAYLVGIDSHRDSDVRSVLAPLTAVAERTGCAIVAVAHLNKRSDGSPMERIGGSIGLVAACRLAWLVMRDPEMPAIRYVLNIKSNVAREQAGLKFEVQDYGDGAAVAWHDNPAGESADQLLSRAAKDRRDRKTQDAEGWLKVRLADGPVDSDELLAEAKEEGYTRDTYYNARRKLRVVKRKCGAPGGEQKWMVGLPDAEDTVQHPPSP